MKKLMICILCLASIPCFAQFRLGIQGSYSPLLYWQTDGHEGLSPNEYVWAINGFQAGVFGEYDLGYSGLELQPALMYALNGAHVGQTMGFADDPNFTYYYQDTHINVYSLRLPINLLYSYRVSPKFKVFGGLGPYFAYNLSGNEKGNFSGDSSNNNTYTFRLNNKLKFNNNASYAFLGQSNYSPIDIGMDILLGFQYKKLQVSATWNRGFTRQYHTPYVNMGNQFWNITLGYVLFGHERKPKL
jgi:outer membrane protein with beta-barrel domain